MFKLTVPDFKLSKASIGLVILMTALSCIPGRTLGSLLTSAMAARNELTNLGSSKMPPSERKEKERENC